MKPRRAKPFFMRHPWVFSGAVRSTDGEPQNGDVVRVTDDRNTFIGWALYNADSQIVARLVSWNKDEVVDEGFWAAKIAQARFLREDILRLHERTDAYRLCHSESDGIPGLVVDRYGDYLVCQLHTAGLVARRDLFLRILGAQFRPRGILDASDPEILKKENCPSSRGLLVGEAPPARIELREGKLKFLVDVAGGQKTGWFLDQRDNRWSAARFAQGRRVLDVFCYTGGFGLVAAIEGKASEVVGVDRSKAAIAVAEENARLNRVQNITFRTESAVAEMSRLCEAGERFGLVVLDPPRFARSRAALPRALEGYHKVNALGMRLVEPGGTLVTCSCSHHVSEEHLVAAVNSAAVDTGRTVQIIERRSQAPDHPVIASCPESRYLKCLICRVL